MTLVAFVLSDVVLVLLLPPEGRAVVLSGAGMLVAAKVVASPTAIAGPIAARPPVIVGASGP